MWLLLPWLLSLPCSWFLSLWVLLISWLFCLFLGFALPADGRWETALPPTCDPAQHFDILCSAWVWCSLSPLLLEDYKHWLIPSCGSHLVVDNIWRNSTSHVVVLGTLQFLQTPQLPISWPHTANQIISWKFQNLSSQAWSHQCSQLSPALVESTPHLACRILRAYFMSIRMTCMCLWL